MELHIYCPVGHLLSHCGLPRKFDNLHCVSYFPLMPELLHIIAIMHNAQPIYIARHSVH